MDFPIFFRFCDFLQKAITDGPAPLIVTPKAPALSALFFTFEKPGIKCFLAGSTITSWIDLPIRSESLSKNPETILAAFERFAVKSDNLTVFGITALETFVFFFGTFNFGTAIHNVEMIPGGGAKIARAAGSSVQITGSDGEYSIIKLASGEIRKIISRAKATIGVLSNPDQKNIKIGKAGRSRWLGIRPSVRGVVMNPVDHPHGGGEGKSSGGRNPVSPWGQSAKGLKTRNNKRTNKYIISRRKKRV